MARASYIYVVFSAPDPYVVTAFTVKHELATWWENQSERERHYFTVWRCRDGIFLSNEEREPVRMLPEEFL